MGMTEEKTSAFLKELQMSAKEKERNVRLHAIYGKEEYPYWNLFMAIIERAREDLLGPDAARYREEIREFFSKGIVASVTSNQFGEWAFEQLEMQCERKQENGVF